MTLYNHAKACPSVSSHDVKFLVAYLSKAAKSEKERVEVFCYWIAENIAYDTQGYTSDKFSPTSGILKSKKGVCQNYAELLEQMCEQSGIECHVVAGYSKGYGYTKNKIFTTPDHAWNVVKTDGNYYYIDATWAAGCTDNIKGKFTYIKKLDITQLFAEPNYFLTRHLPADPRWQLRKNPVTLKSFSANDSIKDILKASLSNYNYSDSIIVYLKLSKPDRRIISALSTYNFNPAQENLTELGNAFYDKAWNLSNTGSSKISDYESAKVLYDKSILIYRKMNNNYGVKWSQNAKSGIDLCNSQITILKASAGKSKN